MGKILPYVKLVQKLKDRCEPISIQFNITNKCGCKCVMCKKWDWKLGTMPFNVVSNLIKQFENNGVESIVFSGGDPLVYPKFEEIVKLTNLKIGVLTAGNIPFTGWKTLTEKADWIRFSVDAADLNKWKEIRGSTSAGYEYLIKNLEEVSELKGKAAVRLNFCRIKDVNEDQEEKVKELAEKCGFAFMAHEVRVFEQFMNKIEHNETIPKTCIIPFLHCVIEADGSVFPCCDVMNENAEFEKVNFNYSLGNLKDFDYDFYQLWHSEKANKIKNFLLNNRVTECATCPARYYSCNIEYEKESERVMFL